VNRIRNETDDPIFIHVSDEAHQAIGSLANQLNLSTSFRELPVQRMKNKLRSQTLETINTEDQEGIL
jgi:hypothetical protein